MQQHITLAAWVNIVLGWIGIGLASIAIAVLLYFTIAAWSPSSNYGVFGLMLLPLSVLQFVFSIAQLIGGQKLLAGKKGMTGLVVVSVISLLAFPIGTIIGAYTIWVVTTCKDLLVDPSTVKHPHTEQMTQEGITYNGKYYAFGEMHFDKLDDAFEYARQLKHQHISA